MRTGADPPKCARFQQSAAAAAAQNLPTNAPAATTASQVWRIPAECRQWCRSSRTVEANPRHRLAHAHARQPVFLRTPAWSPIPPFLYEQWYLGLHALPSRRFVTFRATENSDALPSRRVVSFRATENSDDRQNPRVPSIAGEVVAENGTFCVFLDPHKPPAVTPHCTIAHPGHGNLWRESVFSDVVLCVENAPTPNQDSAPFSDRNKLGAAHTVLQQFPAHRSILSASPVFEAQMLRWHGDDTAADSSSSSKRQIRLTLPDDSYEPAAMAVLAVLYLMKPVREQLAELTGDQQVQAAVLADEWQVPAAGSAAVEILTAAVADSAEGLPAAAFDQLLGMPAVPACLLPLLHEALLSKFGDLEAVVADAALQKALRELPLFAVELLLCSDKLKAGQSHMAALPPLLLPVLQQALLGRFGDLEAVWADAELREALMKLPLLALELLLSSDKLQVASEDTVLYTAQAYVKRLPTGQQQVAQDRLAPVVRCPHLSQFCLTAAVLSDDAPELLLGGLQPQLKRLMLVQQASSTKPTAFEIREDVPGVPSDWLEPARVIKPVSSVGVEWPVGVADIRQAAPKAASSGEAVCLESPSTAPLQGVTWHMTLQCDATKKGSTVVRVFVCADNLPASTIISGRYTLECVDFVRPWAATAHFTSTSSPGRSWGSSDFFGVGAMSGGFDAAVWAGRGLPAEGQLVFKLTVEHGY